MGGGQMSRSWYQ